MANKKAAKESGLTVERLEAAALELESAIAKLRAR
jgi:hypothetical protein